MVGGDFSNNNLYDQLNSGENIQYFLTLLHIDILIWECVSRIFICGLV